MSGEGFGGGALQALHGGFERLAAPVAFPLRRLAFAAALTPLAWPLEARRIRAHAGASDSGGAGWRGVALFLASQTGRTLLDYALQRSVQQVVAEVQAAAAVAEEEEAGAAPSRGGVAERVARVARLAAVVAGVAFVSWVARLWLRARLRRAVLGEAASSRLIVSPSVWSVVCDAFLSVFPFGRLEMLRRPAGLAVRNLLGQAEVRMSLDEEHGALSSLEHAIDEDPRGWGVLIAGLPHAAALEILEWL